MSGEANIAATSTVAGYVMAGGQSTRFSGDKARVELGGKPMLARISNLIVEVTGSVSVVAPPRRYDEFDLWIVETEGR